MRARDVYTDAMMSTGGGSEHARQRRSPFFITRNMRFDPAPFINRFSAAHNSHAVAANQGRVFSERAVQFSGSSCKRNAKPLNRTFLNVQAARANAVSPDRPVVPDVTAAMVAMVNRATSDFQASRCHCRMTTLLSTSSARANRRLEHLANRVSLALQDFLVFLSY